ncbi:hypothetical protein BBB50_15910 [Vibrio cholerae 2740-80]|uniref:Uncharacterized protein n=1 Tax=Vibrio cholerae TaxID=666 RepID=A0A655SJT2_VIBCL|nr:hypothetical protein [Vibrio cholerae]AFC59914.1 hypothetical protein O3Y_15478 [Vibrio cholerae IEC224]ANR89155.1 hypothetical protein BBB50_15910 [Vibrio cholerae 2740-80]KEH04137.1 hypothetical protein M234_09975 [Vibrio cholerae 2012EL-1759]KJD14984.1 hypothetical protein UN67_17245 [Vibrio cholerae O1 biovar El Tor]OFJ40348.1 hypothetical protein BFX33_14540 [Vibrio cholerae V52]QHQ92396.1 hypothetical protein FKV26_18105 [Vibrio cholerae O1]
MDLSKLEHHFELLEELGFITNCPPEVHLQIFHDTLHGYCHKLNEHAIGIGAYDEPVYESVHYNEPSGNYIAIYKNMEPFKSKALKLVNEHAENEAVSFGRKRSWR